MKRLVILWVMVLTLSGCAAILSSPPTRPVVQDSVGSMDTGKQDNRIGTLATVAQRRMVLIRFQDGRFCAEPPPDAVDNISAAFSAALSVTKPESTAAGASLAAALATYAKQLFFRSQGLQLYRDGMFSLCNAYLNGAIDEKTYSQKQDALLVTVQDLIKSELDKLKDIRTDQGTTTIPTAPTPPVVKPPVGNSP